MCSIFFASGLNTLLQTTWGDRLPIVQGGSFSFITPAFAIIGNVAARNVFESCDPASDICHERFLVRNPRTHVPRQCLAQCVHALKRVCDSLNSSTD